MLNRHMTWRRQLATQLWLTLAGLFVAVPILWLARLAFDSTILTRPKEFALLPLGWTFVNLAQAWSAPRAGFSFLHLLGNSLFVAGSTALIAVVFGTTAAYAFARYRFPGREAGLFATLALLTLPPAGLMAPYFLILNDLGVRRSLISMVLVYSTIAVPFAIWTVRNAVQGVPYELEEAATLDGASPQAIFTRITLPLIVPSVAVAGFIGFALAWSEFALGWTFISDPGRVTLAMAINSMVGVNSVSWGLLSATSLLVMLPIMLVFFALGKYMIAGLSLGTASADT